MLEQVVPLAAWRGVTSGFGAVAAMATKSASVVSTASTPSALATAGLQSAGGQFGQSIQAGGDEATARSKAFKAGTSTAVITGIFEHIGMGGVERVAQGKAVADITLKDLMARNLTRASFVLPRTFSSPLWGRLPRRQSTSFPSLSLRPVSTPTLADAWS